MASQVLYFFYSKYSPACVSVGATIKQLQPLFNIQTICVDDPYTRQKMHEASIKTVPCLIVYTPYNISTYEGQEFMTFLGELQKISAARMNPGGQTTLGEQPHQQQQSVIQSIVPPPSAQAPPVHPLQGQNMTQSMNERLQPPVISSPPPAQPILTTQVTGTGQGQSVLQQAQQMAAHQQQQMTAMAQPLPAAQPAFDPSQIQMPPIGQPIGQPMVAQQQPAMMPAETQLPSAPASTAGLFNNQNGLSPQDINPGGAIISRMNNGGSNGTGGTGSSVREMMQAMERERAEADRVVDPRMTLMQQAAAQAAQQQAMMNGGGGNPGMPGMTQGMGGSEQQAGFPGAQMF